MSIIPSEVNRNCRDAARDLLGAVLGCKAAGRKGERYTGRAEVRDKKEEELIVATVMLLMLTLEDNNPIGRV